MFNATAGSGSAWISRIQRWTIQHPRWALTLIALAVLAPFLGKPFNIDDPLFIWAAQHIQAQPGNPYNFPVEWGWTQFPMWKVTENPPLICYYLALVGSIFGWSEFALHTALLLPVIAVLLGTHRLAGNFCGHPMLAAVVTLATPVFLVSSMTVMCDMAMLAFWVWAVVCWVEGTAEEHLGKLCAGACLIALAELTKYYGACLMPLLAAYSLFCRRPIRRWAHFLLIPLAVLLAYQQATQALYGNSLLYNAAHYASFSQDLFGFSKFQNCLTALAFTGGCVAAVAMFAPLLWRKRTLAIFLGVGAAVTILDLASAGFWKKHGAIDPPARLWVGIQIGFWTAGGVALLGLAIADAWRGRNPQASLLALWVFGTFVFVALINWTVNARSILPLTPAVGILLVRRLERNGGCAGTGWLPRVTLALAVSLTLAAAALQADFATAAAVRHNAREACAKFAGQVPTLWYQGHWGFQFYMNAGGAVPVDFKHPGLKPGDAVAVPSNNTNIRQLDSRAAKLVETFATSGPWLLTTCDERMGFRILRRGARAIAVRVWPRAGRNGCGLFFEPAEVAVHGFQRQNPNRRLTGKQEHES